MNTQEGSTQIFIAAFIVLAIVVGIAVGVSNSRAHIRDQSALQDVILDEGVDLAENIGVTKPEPVSNLVISDQNTACNFMLANLAPGDSVSSPLDIQAVSIYDTSIPCSWSVFEGEAGHAAIYDSTKTIMYGNALLTVVDGFDYEGPNSFDATIILDPLPADGDELFILVSDNNPSDSEGQSHAIEFSLTYRS